VQWELPKVRSWGCGKVRCWGILWGQHLVPMMDCQMEQHLELLWVGCWGYYWDCHWGTDWGQQWVPY
jgi:hypothetical protein